MENNLEAPTKLLELPAHFHAVPLIARFSYPPWKAFVHLKTWYNDTSYMKLTRGDSS